MIRLNFFTLFLAAIFFTQANQTLAQTPKLTAQTRFAAGKASPQGELRDYLRPGNVYQFNIFGGAKVDVKFVGAVGLGWDFAYSEHAFKNDLKGHYRRFAWDWFQLPLGFNFFYVKPGLNWVLTNIKIPELSIDESSIRPEFMFEAGMRIGLGSNFALTGGGRGEWAWLDIEKTTYGEDLAITGNYGS